MKRSPMRVIELCVYALIIIAAIVWMLSGGKLYNPPGIPPPNRSTVTQTQPAPSSASPAIIPKGEIFPE